LIEKVGPNFARALETYPDVAKGIRVADGHIYSLPYIMDVMATRIISKMFMNKKWLDQIGKDMPTTTDELYEVLKAIKTSDANGNNTEDEIPLTAPNYNQIQWTLRGAFGLGNRGTSCGFIDMDESTGKVRFWPADPRYKDFLMYVNKLFTEGLIDQDLYTGTNVIGKIPQNIIGAFVQINHNPITGTIYEEDFEGLPGPLTGPYGDNLWSAVNAQLWNPGAFVMTNVNKYPEETIRWVDYLYSDEGIKLYFVGKEGETCYVDENGNYKYIAEIERNPNGLTFDQSVGQYFAWAGQGNPSIAIEKYYNSAEMLPLTRKAAENLAPYINKEGWAAFAYTKEETEKKVPIDTQLNTYVNQMTAQFITGEKPFTEWDEYINQLKSMGLEESMQITQAAYERYKSK